MKKASLVAALCLLMLPVFGYSDTVYSLGFSGVFPGGGLDVTSGGAISGYDIPMYFLSSSTGGLYGLGGGSAWGTAVLSFTGTEVAGTGVGGIYDFVLDSATVTGYGAGVPYSYPYATILSLTPGFSTVLNNDVLNCNPSGCSVSFNAVPVTVNPSLVSTVYPGAPAGNWGLNASLGFYSPGCATAHPPTCGVGSAFDVAESGAAMTALMGPTPPPPPPVPEPATLSLLGTGLIGLLGLRRRR